MFKQFKKCILPSGLEINLQKTEVMWIGAQRTKREKVLGITWPDNPFKALGIYFTYDKALDNQSR